MQRKIMNDETSRLVSSLDTEKMDAFEISGSKWRAAAWRSYSNAEFPDVEIDVRPYPGLFDIVIAEQVWEHLRYPRRGLLNARAMLKPGGYLLSTTPFLIRVHPHPSDCTRWTAEGLKYLLQDCGFDETSIRVGSWGNLAAVIANLTQWSRYDASHNAFHPLHNDPFYPVAVWALARKDAPLGFVASDEIDAKK